VASLRVCGWTDAAVAHAIDAGAGAVGAGVVEVWGGEGFWGFAAVDAGQEKGGSALENWERGSVEEVGEADMDGFFAAADGQGEAAVGVELYAEAGWAAVAIEAGEHALEEGGAARDALGEFWHSFSWVVYDVGRGGAKFAA